MSLKFLSPIVAALLLLGGHQVYSRTIAQPPEESLLEPTTAEQLNNLSLLEDQNLAHEDEKRALIAEYQQLKASGQTEAAQTLRKKIVDLTAEEFKKLEAERKSRVAKLEERLNLLRQALQQREANSEKIVQRRVGELLGEGDELAWDFEVAEDEAPMLLELEPAFDEAAVGTPSPLALPANRPQAPDPNLTLGYGLALSQLDQYRKAIAEQELRIKAANEQLQAMKKQLENLANELQGDKFGDKALNEAYSKVLDEYRAGADRLRIAQNALQEARMRYDELDLGLIPLRKKMDSIYGNDLETPADPSVATDPFGAGPQTNPIGVTPPADPFGANPVNKK